MKTTDELKGARISRRTLFRAASLVAGGVALASITSEAGPSRAAPAKAHQKTVSYQPTPKGKARCEICSKFQPPSACEIVEGVISPKGWCSSYAPKT